MCTNLSLLHDFKHGLNQKKYGMCFLVHEKIYLTGGCKMMHILDELRFLCICGQQLLS